VRQLIANRRRIMKAVLVIGTIITALATAAVAGAGGQALEVGEHRDPTDLLRRHHDMLHRCDSMGGAPKTAKRCSPPVSLIRGTR